MSSVIYKPRGPAGEYAEWAYNPFLGCTHGCTYCLSGDTLILKSDMLAIPLHEIQVGDELLGTAVLGQGLANNTKFVPSKVEAIWTTRKRIFEIELENGMIAQCSRDHRWLTNRGWKFTTGHMSGKGRRPYLTTNNHIRIVTSPMQTPIVTEDYKRGYLSGIIRGDGHIGTHGHYRRERIRKDRPNNPYIRVESQHAFTLRLTDQEPLDRATVYLAYFGVKVSRFRFNDKMQGIRTNARDKIDRIKDLISWRDTVEYLRGFIAGIYDAEGSFSTVVRISNSNPDILAFCEKSLTIGGFPFIYDVSHQSTNTTVHTIRLCGGRETIVKFWQWSDPAIKRKRTLLGHSLKGRSRIIRITDLGHKKTLYDIQTSSRNFVANGMISHNCYGPQILHMSRKTFRNPRPKRDILDRLAQSARAKRGKNLMVTLSFVCDVYMKPDPCSPYMNRRQLEHITRESIRILQTNGHRVTILTKGGTRSQAAFGLLRPGLDRYATSLTLDNDADSLEWEPNASLPRERITALEVVKSLGIAIYASIEPVIYPDQSLHLMATTWPLVNEFKIGKLTKHPHARTVNWRAFVADAVAMLDDLPVKYMLKESLKEYQED